jgi:cytosine/adenosine deaminase-related metal-dependent hydrolase
MFAEMRTASFMNKLVDRNFEAAPAAAVFSASNLAGAEALGRSDLGRIAVGAKADLVIVDPRNLHFGINPDPIRALVHLATPDMVDTVICAGRIMIERGRLLVADEVELLDDVRLSSRRVWAEYPHYDTSGRTVEAAYPPSLPPWTEN